MDESEKKVRIYPPLSLPNSNFDEQPYVEQAAKDKVRAEKAMADYNKGVSLSFCDLVG